MLGTILLDITICLHNILFTWLLGIIEPTVIPTIIGGDIQGISSITKKSTLTLFLEEFKGIIKAGFDFIQ